MLHCRELAVWARSSFMHCNNRLLDDLVGKFEQLMGDRQGERASTQATLLFRAFGQ